MAAPTAPLELFAPHGWMAAKTYAAKWHRKNCQGVPACGVRLWRSQTQEAEVPVGNKRHSGADFVCVACFRVAVGLDTCCAECKAACHCAAKEAS